MSVVQRTISPVDGRVYVERPYATHDDIDRALHRAVEAQRAWRTTPVAERARIGHAFADEFEKRRDEIALELTWQMGRPISAAPGEVRGTLERARFMIDARRTHCATSTPERRAALPASSGASPWASCLPSPPGTIPISSP